MAHEWNNDEYWNEQIADINTWIAENENDEEHEDSIDVLNLNINRGTKKPEKREKCWNSMLLEMRGIEGSPIGGIGRKSNLPTEVQTVLTTVKDGLISAYAEAYTGFVRLVDFRRKKDDAENVIRFQHSDAQAYGKAKASGKIQMLKAAYGADPQEWDGTIEGLETLTTIQEEGEADES